jgi:hypothetical protein
MPEVIQHLQAGADQNRRNMLLDRLTELVRQLGQHMRKWMAVIVGITESFWDPASPQLTEALLALHAEMSSSTPPPPFPLPCVCVFFFFFLCVLFCLFFCFQCFKG